MMLPPNASPLLLAFQDLVAHAFDFDTEISKLWNLGGLDQPLNDLPTVSEEFLPFIAWAFVVGLWPDNDLVNVDDKRRLVRAYREIRQKAGTPFSLDSVYEAIGVQGYLTENPDGDHLRLGVKFQSREKVITPALYDAITRQTRRLVPRRIDIEYVIATSFEGDLTLVGRMAVTPIARFTGGD